MEAWMTFGVVVGLIVWGLAIAELFHLAGIG